MVDAADPFHMEALTPEVWSSVFSYSLCVRSFPRLSRVARSWHGLASSAAAWAGSQVDLVACYPPQSVWKMWSSASALVLEYHTLLLLSVLQKPFLFSSLSYEWQVSHVADGAMMCGVRMSVYPVFPTTSLRLRSIECLHGQPATCCISVGWTSCSSALQLTRVITGEDMIPGDDNVHVCMLHLPNVCRHHSHPRSYLEVQYIRGPVLAGIDDSRPMVSICPFHWSTRLDLSLQMDVRSDIFRIKVADDDGFINMSDHVSVPFSTYNAPSLFDAGFPTWHFFVFAQGESERCVDARMQHTSFSETCVDGGRWPLSF